MFYFVVCFSYFHWNIFHCPSYVDKSLPYCFVRELLRPVGQPMRGSTLLHCCPYQLWPIPQLAPSPLWSHCQWPHIDFKFLRPSRGCPIMMVTMINLKMLLLHVGLGRLECEWYRIAQGRAERTSGESARCHRALTWSIRWKVIRVPGLPLSGRGKYAKVQCMLCWHFSHFSHDL
jgi:hypothetical protein